MYEFSVKGQKKGQKKTKNLKIWAKTYKNWKNFKKGQPHAWDYHMHETDRICPDIDILGKCPEMSVLPDEHKVPH